MFERFTDEGRNVVVTAQGEARALRHNYIGTEHLLLALLRQPRESEVGQVLAGLQLSLEGAREQLLRLVPEGEHPAVGQLPFTPRVKRILELSLREALGRADRAVGPEHIVLALARGDHESVAVQLLGAHHLTRAQLCDAMTAALPPPRPAAARRSLLDRARRSTIQLLPMEVDLADEARRLLMSAGARALDDGRILIAISDIEEALRRRDDAGEPPPQSATG